MVQGGGLMCLSHENVVDVLPRRINSGERARAEQQQQNSETNQGGCRPGGRYMPLHNRILHLRSG